MKVLCVGFSLTGKTKFVLNIISKELFGELEMLEPDKPYPKFKGILSTIACSLISLFNRKPKLKSLKHDLGDYGLVVIGSPVWIGVHAPPVSTFVEENDFKGKKVAIVFTGGADYSQGVDALIARLEDKGAEVVLNTYICSGKNKEVIASKAMKFAEELQTKISSLGKIL
ncbi:MAG: hypothetical protein GOU97_03975 [Nanoarchaeota archaeon]|nr:hypothetical protein [Nanoarchaeota archaeon]